MYKIDRFSSFRLYVVFEPLLVIVDTAVRKPIPCVLYVVNVPLKQVTDMMHEHLLAIYGYFEHDEIVQHLNTFVRAR